MADYVAVLKKNSKRCEFKAFLDEALRVRLVCGLRSKNTQKRLLAESDLTCKRDIEVTQAMESAEKQANNFRTMPVTEQVNALKERTNASKGDVRKP